MNYYSTGTYYCVIACQKNPVLYLYISILAIFLNIVLNHNFILSFLTSYITLQLYIYIFRVLLGLRNFIKNSPELFEKNGMEIRFSGQKNELFVCLDEQKELLGCVGVIMLSETSCEISRMRVATKARRRGIGRKLFKEVPLIVKKNKAAQQCAMAHKVPIPPIHNFGIIVYQMRNR